MLINENRIVIIIIIIIIITVVVVVVEDNMHHLRFGMHYNNVLTYSCKSSKCRCVSEPGCSPIQYDTFPVLVLPLTAHRWLYPCFVHPRRTNVNRSSWICSHSEGSGDTRRSLELPVFKAHQYVLPLTVDVKADVILKYLSSARASLQNWPAEVKHKLRAHIFTECTQSFIKLQQTVRINYCLITRPLAEINNVSVPKPHTKKA
jgi:hypothetical protein